MQTLKDVAGSLSRYSASAPYSVDDVVEAWQHVGAFISDTMRDGKGVKVPGTPAVSLGTW